MTAMQDEPGVILAALCAPLPASALTEREGRWNKETKRAEVFVTFDARAGFNRLDDVLPFGWRTHYRKESMVLDGDTIDFVICRLELRVGGEWIAREGAAAFREMAGASGKPTSGKAIYGWLMKQGDQRGLKDPKSMANALAQEFGLTYLGDLGNDQVAEAYKLARAWVEESIGEALPSDEAQVDVLNTVKTAITESTKLAMVQFGIGRYLYRKGVPDVAVGGFVGGSLAWLPDDDRAQPGLPPSVSHPAGSGSRSAQGSTRTNGQGSFRPEGRPSGNAPGRPQDGPRGGGSIRSGGQLWYEAEKTGHGNELQEWGLNRGYADRMSVWNAGQIESGLAQLARWRQRGGAASVPSGADEGDRLNEDGTGYDDAVPY